MMNFDPHFTKIILDLLKWVYKYDPARIDEYNRSKRKEKVIQEFFKLREKFEENCTDSLPNIIMLCLKNELSDDSRDLDRKVQRMIANF